MFPVIDRADLPPLTRIEYLGTMHSRYVEASKRGNFFLFCWGLFFFCFFVFFLVSVTTTSIILPFDDQGFRDVCRPIGTYFVHFEVAQRIFARKVPEYAGVLQDLKLDAPKVLPWKPCSRTL